MQQQQQMGQQMGNQQQPITTEPPQVITGKDLNYLEDIMSWQLNAIKKCHHFAQECVDQDIKQAIDRAGQMHARHYQLLLQHCQNNNAQQMASIPQQ